MADIRRGSPDANMVECTGITGMQGAGETTHIAIYVIAHDDHYHAIEIVSSVHDIDSIDEAQVLIPARLGMASMLGLIDGFEPMTDKELDGLKTYLPKEH